MSVRALRSAWVAGALFGALAAPAPASPDPAPRKGSVRERAAAFLAAYRNGDAAEMDAIARANDAYMLSWILLAEHAAAIVAAADAAPPLGAARALADRAAAVPGNERLRAWVESRAALPADSLRREAELYPVLLAASDAIDARKPQEALDRMRAASADVRHADAMTRAVFARARVHAIQKLALRDGSEAEAAREMADSAAAAAWLRGEANAWRMLGAARLHAREFRDAADAFEHALALHQRLGSEIDRTFRIGAKNSLAIALSGLGDVRAASLFEEAAEEFLAEGNRASAAGTFDNAARAAAEQHRPEAALALRARALTVAEQALAEIDAQADPAAFADATDTLGTLLARAGRSAEATARFQQSLDAYARAGNRRGALRARMRLARIRLQSCPPEALTDIERAIDEARTIRDASLEIDALVLGARAAIQLRQGARAAELASDAIAKAEATRDRFRAADAVYALAGARYASGDLGAALDLYRRAVTELGALGRDDTLALSDVASTLDKLGLRNEALSAFDAVAGRARNGRNRYQEALALHNRGVVLCHLERFPEAVESLRGALALRDEDGDQQGVALSAGCLAGALLDAGDARAALDHAARAEEALARIANGLGEVEATEYRRLAHEDARHALAAYAHLEVPDAAKAKETVFAAAERGHALHLAGGIASRAALRRARLSAASAAAEDEGYVHVAAEHRNVVALARDGASAGELALARQDLDAAYAELEQVQARTDRETRRAAGVEPASPVALAELEKALGPGTAWVLFHIDESSFALVVRPGTLAVVRLPSRDEIGAKVTAWQEALSSGTKEANLAAQLYDLLLRPLEPALGDTHRLVVSPEGPLALLPLEALQRASEERVIDRWEISYVPSATSLVALQRMADARAPGDGILVLADPVYPSEAAAAAPARSSDLAALAALPRLAGTALEARLVADQFPRPKQTVLVREAATVAALRQRLAAASTPLAILHIACHGYLDTERPALTGLVLGGGEVLGLGAIAAMDVSADLAILSACRSAAGADLRGEGVRGMARALFYAGAPRVVVSSWEVPDEETAEFMAAFVRAIRTDGLAPAAALRKAKLDAIAAGRASPAQWAGFVLWGLPR